jgi:hypothetical protein
MAAGWRLERDLRQEIDVNLENAKSRPFLSGFFVVHFPGDQAFLPFLINGVFSELRR